MRRAPTSGMSDASIYQRFYNRFTGVEYAADETTIGSTRSPDAVNLVSDANGYPEKRLGWRAICRNSEYDDVKKPIFGIHHFANGGNDEVLVYTRGGLYRLEDSGLTLVGSAGSNVGDEYSHSIPFGGKLYLLISGKYCCYDGESLSYVRNDAYIPITSVLCNPAGGGESYQPVNLLTRWRKNRFVTDGTSTVFHVDTGRFSYDTVNDVRCWNLLDGTEYDSSSFTADGDAGTITFDVAPEAPANAGTDALEIQFRHGSDEGERRISNCRYGVTFGANADNRIFLTGNPNYPNRIFCSALNDPSYFPDTFYQDVGVSNFAIRCLLKTSNGELAVIKEQNDQEANIWHVSAELNEESANGAYFPMREGVTGIGGLNFRACGVLNDDPIFVSRDGVFAVTTSYSYSKYVSNIARRSQYIDRKLMFDNELENACCCIWRSKLLIFAGGHVYVADGSQARSGGQYEWFYWDNVPARCVCAVGDKIYFGTDDGRVCMFNTDMVTSDNEPRMMAFCDYPVVGSEDGVAITARWTTKIDELGNFFRLKMIERRGSGLLLKSYVRSGVKLSYRIVDKDKHTVKTFEFDRFNFEEVAFDDFAFNTQDSRVCPMRKKIRRFPAIQFIIENDAPHEAFGVVGLTLAYSYMRPY